MSAFEQPDAHFAHRIDMLDAAGGSKSIGAYGCPKNSTHCHRRSDG